MKNIVTVIVLSLFTVIGFVGCGKKTELLSACSEATSPEVCGEPTKFKGNLECVWDREAYTGEGVCSEK